jgi:hypothetical protein
MESSKSTANLDRRCVVFFFFFELFEIGVPTEAGEPPQLEVLVLALKGEQDSLFNSFSHSIRASNTPLSDDKLLEFALF